MLPVLILVDLVALMFYDVLLAGGKVLLVKPGYDMWAYFYWMRDWGFDQLRHGKLALWNPHISCGTPFFGGCQPGLLYPLNWPALFMSTAAGVNWTISIHVLLAGLLTYMWVRQHGVSRLAGLLAGSIYMFCGAYFFKILAGHPTFIFAGAWLPLVLWSVDKIFSTGQVRWSLIGGMAVAMQVLAGSPQYASYTGITAALYALLNLIRHRERWLPVLVGGGIMAGLAAALCAGQIFPLLALAAESIRSEGFGPEGAAFGALEPVAFLTLICPYVFGHRDFGIIVSGIRQLQLNIGAVGLILAGYAIFHVEARRRRFAVCVIVILLIVALGPHTPVFGFLFKHVGLFRSFRMVARLGLFANLFMALLAALALDRIRSADLRPWFLAACCMVLGLAMAILAVSMDLTRRRPDGGVYGAMMKLADPSGEFYQIARSDSGRAMPGKARFTAQMVGVSALGFLLGGAALLLWRVPRVRVYALTTIAIAELFVAARVSRMSLPLSQAFDTPDEWLAGIERVRPTERTFHVRWGTPNQVMGNRAFDANGYEAAVLRRFRQMETLVTKDSKHNEKITASLEKLPGLCQLMRVRYILGDKPLRTIEMPRPMGRVELLDRCQVLPDMPAVFEVMNDPAFDPRRAALLESPPDIRPEPGGATGSASVVRYESDEMEIIADVPRPAILLITDSYSRDWQVTALSDSSQKRYTLMPADLLMRAIPLGAGRHHLKLEYRPPYYVLGLWVSGVSAMACLGALGVWVWSISCFALPPA
ncbi:MAG: hypothetical protein ACHRHE_05240 [Tepidisphaerales bacterium]